MEDQREGYFDERGHPLFLHSTRPAPATRRVELRLAPEAQLCAPLRHRRERDDGKSTLVGRLLFDTRALFRDQVARPAASRRRGAEETDLALATGSAPSGAGTIDVAWRYFAGAPVRARRSPGLAYTRNMATAAPPRTWRLPWTRRRACSADAAPPRDCATFGVPGIRSR